MRKSATGRVPRARPAILPRRIGDRGATFDRGRIPCPAISSPVVNLGRPGHQTPLRRRPLGRALVRPSHLAPCRCWVRRPRERARMSSGEHVRGVAGLHHPRRRGGGVKRRLTTREGKSTRHQDRGIGAGADSLPAPARNSRRPEPSARSVTCHEWAPRAFRRFGCPKIRGRYPSSRPGRMSYSRARPHDDPRGEETP